VSIGTVPVNEAELIEKAQGGDLRAFSLLVESYQERAVRVAYSILGNLEDARDEAQEAFVRAYEGLGRFRGGSRFYTWFYRILVNGCKDALRKRRMRGFFGLGTGRTREEADPLDAVASAEPDARRIVADRELGATIRLEIGKLPLRQRTAFTLRYLDGRSIEEIAETMELSTGAVKAHLWQAAEKMRRALGPARSGEV